MIDRTALLEDLKRLVTRVEADLLARSEDADVPEIAEVLRGEYERARAAKRTADTYGEWREDRITQAAVAWVLSCVFVRFLEDNDLISPPRIAGPGERLRQARDAHQHYFMSHPRDTDREYLLSIFDELAATPGTSGIFGPHNALREIPNWLSGDKAREVIQFFQKIDANTGLLVHDFTDQAWDTRFLGDLYQDLSAYARSRYALLQTPHFIEQFLLDRTLEPAIDEFGLTDSFKMIDPACGSGHLVLGSFARILDRWQRSEPATPVRELVRRTLSSVHGVDINPFAVAIARFRLLLVAMRACEIKRLADAPDFRLNIECGDSLLHVPLIGGQTQLFATHEMGLKPKKGKGPKKEAASEDECAHAYASENLAALKAILRYSQYHAVMANPPYIVVRDSELNERYRKRFSTCHRQYSLAVPFMEHIYALCVRGGFTGQITANSFMKREFGKPLIERFLTTVNLTLVIDTSIVYVPGHGTPTVMLFGSRRPPVAETLRVVMGIRGDPSTPADPARGVAWQAITQQVDHPGSQSEYVSVADLPRQTLSTHPWSIGGGGASELKERLAKHSCGLLGEIVSEIGFVCMTRADDIYFADPTAFRRRRIKPCHYIANVEGDKVRNWFINTPASTVFPYGADLEPIPCDPDSPVIRFLWPHRNRLWLRREPNGNHHEIGLPWYVWSRFLKARFRSPLLIVFPEVATHNHFVLDRGGKAFKQTAPVVKLKPNSTEDEHLALLGILNSSTACFWMKQVAMCKGLGGQGGGIKPEHWHRDYAFNGTKLLSFPVPHNYASVVTRSRSCDELAQSIAALTPAAIIAAQQPQLRERLAVARDQRASLFGRLVAAQEELDWEVYRLYGLCNATSCADSDVARGLHPEQRPCETVLREAVSSEGHKSSFYEVHIHRGVEAAPALSATMTDVLKQRLSIIQSIPDVRTIETVNYKRRWQITPWAKDQAAALEAFLLDRLERLFDFDGRMNDTGKPTATLSIGLVSIGGLADAAAHDPLFMEAAEVFVGAAGFDVTALIGQLVEKAAVPFLPVLRYKATGLRKHEEWKDVWELQRKEDAIDARTTLPSADRSHLSPEQAAELKRREVGDIPVPPTYTSADFVSGTYWSHRGKLDVPKERFISFPFVTGADGQTMIAWAGLDHLQLAKAIGDFYGLVQNDIGGSDDPRLVPLLAAIHELLPWIRQWHAGNDPVYGGEPADFFEDFLRTEAAGRGMTVAEVIAWQPPARTRAKRAAKKAAKRATRRSQSEAASPTPESAES